LAEVWDSEDPPRAFKVVGAGWVGVFAESVIPAVGPLVFFLELELEELLEGILLLVGDTVGFETSAAGATGFEGVFGKAIFGEGVFGKSVFGDGVFGREVFGVFGAEGFGDDFSNAGTASPVLFAFVA